MAKVENYIFVDEAGDPGPITTTDPITNEATETGASSFYIICALCVSTQTLHRLQHRMMEIKALFNYKKEIKSTDVSLPLYKALLELLNELEVSSYYRLIDKRAYRGVFRVIGKPVLHNVFDEFNVVRAVAFAIADLNIKNVEVVIDRTDRRLLDGRFDSFNTYLLKKVRKYIGENSKDRVTHITHVDSEYVALMQMSDLISGAIRDMFTGKNKELIERIFPKNLREATGKYERRKI